MWTQPGLWRMAASLMVVAALSPTRTMRLQVQLMTAATVVLSQATQLVVVRLTQQALELPPVPLLEPLPMALPCSWLLVDTETKRPLTVDLVRCQAQVATLTALWVAVTGCQALATED